MSMNIILGILKKMTVPAIFLLKYGETVLKHICHLIAVNLLTFFIYRREAGPAWERFEFLFDHYLIMFPVQI